jgi:hypothetical protein
MDMSVHNTYAAAHAAAYTYAEASAYANAAAAADRKRMMAKIIRFGVKILNERPDGKGETK